ncbi:hypothetical protein FQN60_006204, partial [Etheostoma spectabile]
MGNEKKMDMAGQNNNAVPKEKMMQGEPKASLDTSPHAEIHSLLHRLVRPLGERVQRGEHRSSYLLGEEIHQSGDDAQSLARLEKLLTLELLSKWLEKTNITSVSISLPKTNITSTLSLQGYDFEQGTSSSALKNGSSGLACPIQSNADSGSSNATPSLEVVGIQLYSQHWASQQVAVLSLRGKEARRSSRRTGSSLVAADAN